MTPKLISEETFMKKIPRDALALAAAAAIVLTGCDTAGGSAVARPAPAPPGAPIHGVQYRNGEPQYCTPADRAELQLLPQDTCEVVPDNPDEWIPMDAGGQWWCAVDPGAPQWVRDAREGPC